MKTLDALLDAIAKESARAEFPVDIPAYERAGRDPRTPILFAGNLFAPVCVFGRDLGKDEVAEGEPLIGSAGRAVRSGIFRTLHRADPPAADRWLRSVLDFVLLTNTVPYKPPGNKAYANEVKERLRPFVEDLLVNHWRGSRLICLGTEACAWFANCGDAAALREFWAAGDQRYECELEREIIANGRSKTITLCPLPHPSPRNQRWYSRFPELLAKRLVSYGSVV
jgi:uracil-DNA glycosylase